MFDTMEVTIFPGLGYRHDYTGTCIMNLNDDFTLHHVSLFHCEFE